MDATDLAHKIIAMRATATRLVLDITIRNVLPGIWYALTDTTSFILDREGLEYKRLTLQNYREGTPGAKASDVTKATNDHWNTIAIHAVAALIGSAVLLIIYLVGVSREPLTQQIIVGLLLATCFGIYGTNRLDPSIPIETEYEEEMTTDQQRRLTLALERIFTTETRHADQTQTATGRRPWVISPFDIALSEIGWQAVVTLPFARSVDELTNKKAFASIAAGVHATKQRIVIEPAPGNDNVAEITVLDVPFGERDIGQWPNYKQEANIFEPYLWGTDKMGQHVHVHVAPFNWLIAGESGAGKSTQLMQLMMWAVAYPWSIHIVTDPTESGDFAAMRPLSLVYREGQSKNDERAVKDAMQFAVSDIPRRNKQRQKYKHLQNGSNTVNHQIVMQDPSLAPLIIWADEFQVWANETWFLEAMDTIQRTGRKAGVFCIAGTQDVSKDSGLSPAMIRLFQSAACGRVSGATSTNLVLGGSAHTDGAKADKLTGAGAFYVRPNKLVNGQRPITLSKSWDVNPLFADHMKWARQLREQAASSRVEGRSADMSWCAGMSETQYTESVDSDEHGLSPLAQLLDRWPVSDDGHADFISLDAAVQIVEHRNDAPSNLDSGSITRWLNKDVTGATKIESSQKMIAGTNTRGYFFHLIKQAL